MPALAVVAVVADLVLAGAVVVAELVVLDLDALAALVTRERSRGEWNPV